MQTSLFGWTTAVIGIGMRALLYKSAMIQKELAFGALHQLIADPAW